MADLNFTVATPSGGVTVASDAAAHTILQVVAPSNHRVRIKSFEIGFKGAVTTDAPIQIRVLRQTTAGTGGTSVTPVNTDAKSETIQSAAQRGVFSAEPTAGSVLWEGTCHPQWSTGKAFPISQEFIVPGGGRIGLEANIPSGAANTAFATIYCEE
jgi:hypothetical protein